MRGKLADFVFVWFFFLKNWHFSSNSSEVEVRLFIFFPEEDIFFYFQHFQGQNIYFQNVPGPPPPQNQMVIPLNNMIFAQD